MAETHSDLPVEGRFDGAEHRFPLRVYFEDTDLSGVVYHANYLRFMERARSDMLRLCRIDQRAEFEASGAAWAVASLEIRYAAPAKLDDALLVLSKVTQVRAAAVHIQQRVMRGGLLLAEAQVLVALVAAGGRPRRLSADWTAKFAALVAEGEEN